MSAKIVTRGTVVIVTLCALVKSALALAESDSGALLVGKRSTTLPPSTMICQYGYITNSGPTIGSYSPTGLTGGDIVEDLFDEEVCGVQGTSILEVGGFSSDPGKSWLTSVTCNSIGKSSSSASYGYSSGTAVWTWTSTFSLSSKSGSNVSCTIVHS